MNSVEEIAKAAAQTHLVWKGDGFLSRLFLGFCRKTPEFPGKRRIYSFISSLLFNEQLRLRNEDGIRFTVDAPDFIGRTIALEGNYEPRSLALAKVLLRAGGNFVDIGCNIGLYTFTVAADSKVQAYSIDASFMALSRFHQNFQRNPHCKVRMVNCAMASDGALKCFELPVPRNLGTTTIVERPPDSASTHFWVASSPLQKILDSLEIPKVNLLKIDVEGYELDVFKSLDFKSRYRPENMIVECDAEFPRAVECYEYLIAQGYIPFTVDGKRVTDPSDLPEKNVWFRCSSLVSA
jgi:FkbM family methyltransferase